jgi:aerobic-type carbon monoxide dehydrogenase small subunit (CoxS/CutS family)
MAGPIQAQINGKSRILASEPDTTLLFALREDLGLTGTKYGCGEGQCGACTVLMNGSPRRSCQLSVSDAAGKSILTIEGFEQNGQLHPVQQAFLDQGAFQCAFCTSGMIVSSVALLQKTPNPSNRKSFKLCKEISAAAALIPASLPPFSRPPKPCTEQNHELG